MADQTAREREKGSGSEDKDEQYDAFLGAIDVACVAKNVQEQAKLADTKAKYIDHLARKAQVEADSLHDVAVGVTTTAMSVAVMALQACQYRSYKEAFTNNPLYSSKIGMDKFLEVIQPLPPVGSPSFQHPVHSSSTSQGLQQVPEDQIENKSSLDTKPSEEISTGLSFPAGYSPGRRRHSLPVQFASNRSIIRELAEHVIKPKNDSSSNFSLSNVNSGTLRKRSNTGTSTEKFVEKYPSHASPVEYKDSIANTIDASANSMTPLWEDRYCIRGTTIGMKSTPYKNTSPQSIEDKKWADRKKEKQFQIKLQKCGLDSSSGSVDLSPEECQQALKDLHQTVHGQRDFASRTNAVISSLEDEDENNISAARRVSVPERSNQLPSNLSSSYDAEGELTSDSEVEEILSEQLQKVKAIDTVGVSGQKILPKSRPGPRCVSPLLNSAEKNNVRMESNRLSPVQKYLYQPGTGEYQADYIPQKESTNPDKDPLQKT